jgi:hypothetical protein
MPLPALQEVLLHRKAQQAQAVYATHLTWLIGAQLFALGGGKDYPVPDALALFPDAALPRDRRTAAQVQQSVLSRLTHPARKENDHG